MSKKDRDDIINWLTSRRERVRRTMVSIGACDNDPSAYAEGLSYVIAEYNELIRDFPEAERAAEGRP